MKTLTWLYRTILRFKYPITLPEEIATDLGIQASNFLSFNDFVCQITSISCRPSKLKRFMTRESAEAAFESAQRKEKFARHSHFSYYLNKGWLGFNLHFDDRSRLRRVYLQHNSLKNDKAIEIPLHQNPSPFLNYLEVK